MEIQAVKTQINNAFTFVATNVKHLGAQTYTYGSRAISYVSPKIAELVGKIKQLQLPSFVKELAAFAVTNTGMSVLGVGGSVTAFILAGKAQSKFVKVTLRLAGVAALVFSVLAASGAVMAPSGLTFSPGRIYIPTTLPRA
ncbi:MAG: hypothetical protein LLF94_08470 [Chlamydiales bacterium]|nr:hypothetical protein [Chlamydiales bacterium]